MKGRCPLPRFDDFSENMRGTKFFASLDVVDEFHQIRMVPANMDKTAAITPLGSFIWKVLPMVAAHAPTMFQRMMNRIFGHFRT